MPHKRNLPSITENLTPEDAFGRVLRERRLALGKTQAALEVETGLEQSYISRLEAGQYQVCLRGILLLARALGISAAELIGEVESLLQLPRRSGGGVHKKGGGE